MTTTRASLISGALRHVRDAEHLAANGDHRSVDQAQHLAGFGPECARKACLSERWADKAIGHDFGTAGERAVAFAAAIDIGAHRFRPDDWVGRYPTLGSWRPDVRYNPTGTAVAESTARLIEQCRRAVDDVVFALWTDGELQGGWS